MSGQLPPGWVEETVTWREFNAALCSFSPRVPHNDVFMVLFEKRGIRMASRFSLEIAPPFEMFQCPRGSYVVVRQGPAVANT